MSKPAYLKCDGDPIFIRLLRIALDLGAGKAVTTRYIMERYGVSRATARRDMTRLECLLAVHVEEDASTKDWRFPKRIMTAPDGVKLCA